MNKFNTKTKQGLKMELAFWVQKQNTEEILRVETLIRNFKINENTREQNNKTNNRTKPLGI